MDEVMDDYGRKSEIIIIFTHYNAIVYYISV